MNPSSLRALAVAILTLCLPAFAQTPEEKGLEIARASDKANAGWGGEDSDVEMDLINAHGDVVKRKLTIKSLEGTDDGDKSISIFHWPADVQNTKMLTWTHKKGDDDQWLYLPSMKKTTRIASRSKQGSFMGSEFSYEDLAAQEVEKFTYKFLEETQLDGRPAWKLERYPVDKNSGYKRQVVWMDKEYQNLVRIDYYDRKDELLKTGLFRGYKKHGNLWRFSEIDMNNLQTKKRSVLKWKSRKLGVTHDGNTFERNGLEE